MLPLSDRVQEWQSCATSWKPCVWGELIQSSLHHLAHPTYPHPVSLLGCKGCSLFDCGANAHTDSTLILILVWWILRNIIPQSSLAVSRFWEEVNVSPILSQGGPSSCLCELQELEADRKQQNFWVQWLQELGSIGGIEKPVKFPEIGNSAACLNLKNHRIREWKLVLILCIQFNLTTFYWVSTMCQAMLENIAVGQDRCRFLPHYILSGMGMERSNKTGKFMVE